MKFYCLQKFTGAGDESEVFIKGELGNVIKFSWVSDECEKEH